MHIEISLLNFKEAIKIGFDSVYRLFCIKKFQPLFRNKLQNFNRSYMRQKKATEKSDQKH